MATRIWMHVIVSLVCSSAPLAAQTLPPASQPPIVAGPGGVIVQSSDGQYRVQIGLLLQADGRFSIDDPDHTFQNTFLIRRARLYLRGRLTDRFEFLFNPDVAGGMLVLQDAYIDTVFSPALRLRVGKFKTSFGLERLQSASNLMLYERGYPSAIAPNRDVGVAAIGDLAGSVLSYAVAVSNGVPDGSSGDLDNSDSKDLTARLAVRPFARLQATHPANGLLMALAGTIGRQAGAAALPTFRTAVLQQPFFSYSGAAADGVRTRFSPQASYYYRSLGVIGEFARSSTPVTGGTAVQQTMTHEAWQIAGSWVLTGEPATDLATGVAPRSPFNPSAGTWGAFQIAARYHMLSVGEQAFTFGLAAAGASRKAEAWTVGLNWSLTQNVHYTLVAERTIFDDNADGARPPENAAAFRMQLFF